MIVDVLAFPSDPMCVQDGLREALCKAMDKARLSPDAMKLLRKTLERATELSFVVEKEEKHRADRKAAREKAKAEEAYRLAEEAADEEAELEEELAEELMEAAIAESVALDNELG